MKRPRLLTALAITQWLLAAIYCLLFFTTFPADEGIAAAKTSNIVEHALIIGTSIAAGVGVWRQRIWGQWIALVMLGLLVVGVWGGSPVGLLFVPFLVMHLLPVTWRAFRSPKLETPASSI